MAAEHVSATLHKIGHAFLRNHITCNILRKLVDLRLQNNPENQVRRGKK